MTVQILHGDCLDVMRGLPGASVDSVVTDPPYHLQSIHKRFAKVGRDDKTWSRSGPHQRTAAGFMGQLWDGGDIAFRVELWAEAGRLLKPGGYVVAFGGTRTYHRMACAIEDAGLEIRDQLGWLFGSGFPKSHNQPGGWGTALKPAWEPICLARKPLIGTVAQNVAAHGTGAINIDGCRIGPPTDTRRAKGSSDSGFPHHDDAWTPHLKIGGQCAAGRWPANVCHDGSDEVLEAFARFGAHRGAGAPASGKTLRRGSGRNCMAGGFSGTDVPQTFYADTGTAARFFFCAKADRAERNIGCEGLAERTPEAQYRSIQNGRDGTRDGYEYKRKPLRNNHPTVKPLALMQWLCRLVTPPGGTVLDPFLGSGSTAIAADREGFSCIGIEREAEYMEIARRRIHGDAGMFAQQLDLAPCA